MPRNEQIIKAILNRPWALHPAKLEELSLVIERRLAGEKLDFPVAAAATIGNKAEESFEIRDGVAILPVYGLLDKRMNMFMRYSGGTSTELLARDFQKALGDPQVQAILLDVDSPGGAVDGTKELADLIIAAREQKPVVAYANGLMASAAYWIGSAAQAVIAPATAEIGSIGVALMHYDYSAADEKEGVKRTVITGGKYKRIASDEKPLSKEGREYLQVMVDDYYGLFVEAVSRQRAVEPEIVQERMADGRIFVGKKALKAGLIDQIGNFNDALALARAKGGDMLKTATKEKLQAENPELMQVLLAEGMASITMEILLAQQPEMVQKLRAEGMAGERARVVEILEADGDAAISIQAIKEGTGAAATVKLLLQAEKDGRAKSLSICGRRRRPRWGPSRPKLRRPPTRNNWRNCPSKNGP